MHPIGPHRLTAPAGARDPARVQGQLGVYYEREKGNLRKDLLGS